MPSKMGINFLRNRAYGEFCQYDAKQVADNTAYGQWLIANYGTDYTQYIEGLDPGAWGYDVPWLFGNDYTDWALAQYAAAGIAYVRDWAVIGQWPRLLMSAPKTAGVVSGPIVFDGEYDWSVLDRMVELTASYGMKLELALPHPYTGLVNHCGWANGATVSYTDEYTTVNNLVADYLMAPYAAQLATRYQDYAHIIIDPLNEYTFSKFSGSLKWYQRKIYNAVKNALPVGKKDNIKVQLASQYHNDLLAAVHEIGSEIIYDGYVSDHCYVPSMIGNFNIGTTLQAIRTTLDGYGRTDVKINLGEFGQYSATAPQMASVMNTIVSYLNAGTVKYALYWPLLAVFTNGDSVFSDYNSWNYHSYNPANMPNPFTTETGYQAILNLSLEPVLIIEPEPIVSISTLSIATLTGILTPSPLLSASTLSLIEITGTIAPDPLLSTSVLDEVTMTVAEVNTGSGSIRSPDNQTIRIFTADVYEIETYRYVSGAWQK